MPPKQNRFSEDVEGFLLVQRDRAPLAVTFVKWPPSENVPSVSKARPPGAQGLKLLGARLGTFFTLGAPSCPHGTAAGVHAELSRNWVDAFIFIPLQVALLHTDVYTERSEPESADTLTKHSHTQCPLSTRHEAGPWRCISGQDMQSLSSCKGLHNGSHLGEQEWVPLHKNTCSRKGLLGT